MANFGNLEKGNGKFGEFKPKFAIIRKKIDHFKPESAKLCLN